MDDIYQAEKDLAEIHSQVDWIASQLKDCPPSKAKELLGRLSVEKRRIRNWEKLYGNT